MFRIILFLLSFWLAAAGYGAMSANTSSDAEFNIGQSSFEPFKPDAHENDLLAAGYAYCCCPTEGNNVCCGSAARCGGYIAGCPCIGPSYPP